MVDDFTNILRKMIVEILKKGKIEPFTSVSAFVLEHYEKGDGQRLPIADSGKWDLG